MTCARYVHRLQSPRELGQRGSEPYAYDRPRVLRVGR